MENKIKCSRCRNEEIWKASKPRGKQQYQCKECKKKFITEQNYSKEFKQKAIKIFFEGNSGRAVGRMMGISTSTVYNISDCTEKTYEEEPRMVDIIEMDELFTYTNEKKTELS